MMSSGKREVGEGAESRETGPLSPGKGEFGFERTEVAGPEGWLGGDSRGWRHRFGR